MKILTLLTAIILLLISCKEEKEPKTCDVRNPIQELIWLNDLISNHMNTNPQIQAKIQQFTWNGEDVFLVDLCVNCSDAAINIYDCEGNIICTKGTIAGIDECPEFESEAEFVKNNWNYIPQKITTNASITGYDMTLCACCGGWLFQIGDKIYRDKGKEVNDIMSTIDINDLPLECQIEYFPLDGACENFNHIYVTKFEF